MAWLNKLVRRAFTAPVRAGGRRALVAAAVLVPVAVAAVLVAAVGPAADAASRIPVAVVNGDAGAIDADGRAVAYGEDLVDDLLDSSELAWSVVDEEQAASGLADGTYALVLNIPADYSEKVASVTGDAPEQAVLEVVSDGSGNVLATDAGSAVLKQVQARLKSDLGENYLLSVLSGVRGQAARLTMASDGSVMLDEAYDALETGADAIAQGLDQTAQGTSALTEGIDGIAQGVTALGTGTQAVAQGLDQTADQLAPLAGLSSVIPAGLDGVSQQVSIVARLVGQASDALDAGFTSLSDLAGMAGQLEGPAGALGQAAGDAAGALEQLRAGAADVSDAAAAVQGVTTIADGAGQLAAALDTEGADGQQPGALQQARALAATTATWDDAAMQAQLEAVCELLGDQMITVDGETVSARAVVEQLAGDMAALDTGLTGTDGTGGLVGTLQGAATSAGELAQTADGAVTGLDELGAATDAVEEAASALDDAGSRAVSALEEAGPVVAAAAQSAVSSLGSMAEARAILSEDLVAGANLSEVAAAAAQQLSTHSDDGTTPGLGALVAAQAQGVAVLPAALEGMATATDQLGQGGVALGATLGTVNQGVAGLGDGLAALGSAQGQIAQGVGQLGTMSGSLTDAMTQAADELSGLSTSYTERAQVAASPVRLRTSVINRVEGSAALVPACALIALWTGAAIACALLPASDVRAVLAGRGAASTLAAAAPYAALGLAQALLVGAVAVLAAGAPADPVLFCAVLALASLAFMAIALALKQVLGRAAVPVMIALAVVQAVCGGTILPGVFTQGAFAVLGQVLPVPVATEALLGAMAGAWPGAPAALGCLGAWLVAALGAATAGSLRRGRVRPERAFARAGSCGF